MSKLEEVQRMWGFFTPQEAKELQSVDLCGGAQCLKSSIEASKVNDKKALVTLANILGGLFIKRKNRISR
jgi:hypothetical protein